MIDIFNNIEGALYRELMRPLKNNVLHDINMAPRLIHLELSVYDLTWREIGPARLPVDSELDEE